MLWLQLTSAASFVCYVGISVGWLLAGNRWMAATFLLYAMTGVTLYFAGLPGSDK